MPSPAAAQPATRNFRDRAMFTVIPAPPRPCEQRNLIGRYRPTERVPGGYFVTNGEKPLKVNDVKGEPPKHSSLPSDHATLPVSFRPANKPAVTVPANFATDGLFGTDPNVNVNETLEVLWVFQVIVAVPFAFAFTLPAICVISEVQLALSANFNVAEAVAPLTAPRQPLTLAPLMEIVGRTVCVLPYFGRPGVTVAFPPSDLHVVPAAAPAGVASRAAIGSSAINTTKTRRNLCML